MIFEPGAVLIIGGDIPEHIEECRAYIKRHGLTEEDVKISRLAGDYVKVVTKRRVELKDEQAT